MNRQRIEQALAEVKAGNLDAFRDVIAETAVMLRAFVNFHVHNDDIVNDVLQDVYIAIFHQVGRYQPETDCVSWIKSVARYTALTARKAYVRERGYLKRYRLEVQDQLGAVLAEQDQESPVEDRIQALQDCMKQLTDRARGIVEHRYFQEQSITIVAKKANMSVKSAQVALHRARKLLADCVRKAVGESA